MILAEKIAYLRKQKNWSQEELAQQLEISRQSVSKWESGASIPELDKIIGMSHTFGVSTDFLLKDEYDTNVIPLAEEGQESATPPDNADGQTVRYVSLEEANAYLQLVKEASKWIAAGVLICILSPICLLVMGAWSEYGPVAITEDFAAGLGVTILLVMIAVAVVLFIIAGMKLGSYEYLEKEEIRLQYGVSGIVAKHKEDYTRRYQQMLVTGVSLCILSVIPLIFAAGMGADEIYLVYCVGFLLAIVSIGTYLLVRAGNVWEGYQKLLQEEDYSVEKKMSRRRWGSLAGAYWCLVAAIYLAINLHSNKWDTTWPIWPVAALIFVVLLGIFRAIFPPRRTR